MPGQQVDQAVPPPPRQALAQQDGDGAAPTRAALLAPAKKKRRFRRIIVDKEVCHLPAVASKILVLITRQTELSNSEMATLAASAQAALDHAERAAKIKVAHKVRCSSKNC